MDRLALVDEIATAYPIINLVTINGVECRQLLNLENVYEKIRPLGSGSFGTVSCYRERRSGQLLAFKEILINSRTDIRKLCDEVETLIRLSRDIPSVVQYHASYLHSRDDGSYYIIVTEFIDGFTMHEYIDSLLSARQTIPVASIYGISMWLFTTLAQIHEAGYVHRDIKPENIMFDIKGKRMVLLDFGLSCSVKREHNNLCDEKSLAGTPQFIAPERWAKTITPSRAYFQRATLEDLKKGDVWAAGVTLYTLVERRYPWTGTTVPTLQSQITGPYEIKYSYLDADTVAMIKAALERDPNKRATAASMVERMLDLISLPADDQSTSSRSGSSWSSNSSWNLSSDSLIYASGTMPVRDSVIVTRSFDPLSRLARELTQ